MGMLRAIVLSLLLAAPALGQGLNRERGRYATSAANDLLTSLTAFFELEEASGSCLDAHAGLNFTTLGGDPGSVAGIVGNARDFGLTSLCRRTTAHTAFQVGDVDFTIAAWVNVDLITSRHAIFTKYGGGSNREYLLEYHNTAPSNRFSFWVTSNGTNGRTVGTNAVNSDNAGNVLADTWYFVVAWHDAVNNELSIQVDNGTPNTISYSSGVFVGTANPNIGAAGDGILVHDGFIDQLGFWNGRVLDADDRSFLYNSGSGRAYSELQ